MPTDDYPEVYVGEISSLPSSVAEVETAVPVFIGYTQKASKLVDGDLRNKPAKVKSLDDFERCFGKAYPLELKVETRDGTSGGFEHEFGLPDPGYVLWHCMRAYFGNGGGSCFVVSVGSYRNPPEFSTSRLRQGLDAVRLEDEPTLIVIPEAVYLPETGFQEIVEAALQQCGDLGDRFAILDIMDGGTDPADVDWPHQRALFGNRNLEYGAAYYPFLTTRRNLQHIEDEKIIVRYKASGSRSSTRPLSKWKDENGALFIDVKRELGNSSIDLPPSAAMAGVYAMMDATRGVWKAPANAGLNGILKPVAQVNSQQQQTLNIDPVGGKSVNAIRSFPGMGTLVWGARTLAGNDPEWRYIPVRRFMLMIEESIKKATFWTVFEPNNTSTWTRVRELIESYLEEKWQAGALAGAKPGDAYFVQCGLGSTMTRQDVGEGRLIVLIGLAVTRPAEFMLLKIAHKLQTP